MVVAAVSDTWVTMRHIRVLYRVSVQYFGTRLRNWRIYCLLGVHSLPSCVWCACPHFFSPVYAWVQVCKSAPIVKIWRYLLVNI